MKPVCYNEVQPSKGDNEVKVWMDLGEGFLGAGDTWAVLSVSHS